MTFSSLIPFKSRHLITPLDVLSEECGDTLMDTLASEVDLRRHLECFSIEHLTNSDPFLLRVSPHRPNQSVPFE